MSLRIFSKRTLRIIGAAAAISITAFIGFGFYNVYINVKNEQIEGNGIVPVKIYAEKPAVPAILYEAVPTEECIKQINSDAEKIQESAITVQPNTIDAVNSARGQAVSTEVKDAIDLPKEDPPSTMPIVPAGLPSCTVQSVVPTGVEKLGADGFVALTLNLAANGSVERGEIETSSGFADLDEVALKQVTQTWRFVPCKMADKDVACKHRIRFRWAVVQ